LSIISHPNIIFVLSVSKGELVFCIFFHDADCIFFTTKLAKICREAKFLFLILPIRNLDSLRKYIKHYCKLAELSAFVVKKMI